MLQRPRAWLMSEVSVGRMAPPPDSTRTLHWPQVPPPPQADGTNRSGIGQAAQQLAARPGMIEFSARR